MILMIGVIKIVLAVLLTHFNQQFYAFCFTKTTLIAVILSIQLRSHEKMTG